MHKCSEAELLWTARPWSRLAQIYFLTFLTFAFLVVAADP
jgi:hypothetical protein